MKESEHITVRSSNRSLIAALGWLRDHDAKISEYVREWLERGFKLWLIETAVVDPPLYTDILAALAATTSVEAAEMLREEGNQALRETLAMLVHGLGVRTGGGTGVAAPTADTTVAFDQTDATVDVYYDPDEQFDAL